MTKSSLQAVRKTIQSFFVLTLIPVVNAQTTGSQARPEKIDVETPGKVVERIANVSNALALILFALAAIFIIISAFFYLTAAGNQTQLDKAKNTLIYAIVGIVLGLVAFSVPTLVGNFLK